MKTNDGPQQRAVKRCSQCGTTAYGKDSAGKLLCGDCMVAAIQAARWKIRWAHRIVAGILALGVLLGLYAYQVLESRPTDEFTPAQGFWIAVAESVVAAYSAWAMYWGIPPVWRLWRDVPGKIPLFGWLPWQVRLLLTSYIPFAGGAAYGFIGGGFYEYAKCRKIAQRTLPGADLEAE